jgi:Undecaprenyl-phosphate glucose phosphotransferase
MAVDTIARSFTSAASLGTEQSAERTVPLENISVLVAKIVLAEFAAVSASAYVTSLLYYVAAFQQLPPTKSYGTSALLIAGFVVLVSLASQHYVKPQSKPRHLFLWSGLAGVALSFSFFLSTLFLLKQTEDYSRATFFIQFVATAVAVLFVRAVGHSAIRASITLGRVQARRIVLIGNRTNHAEIRDLLHDSGIQTVRSLPFPGKSLCSSSGDEPGLDWGLVRQMIDACRKLQPDDIVILATAADLSRSRRLSDALSELPISLHVIPVETGGLLGSAQLGNLGALATIQLLQAPLSTIDRLLKRGFDIVAALAGLFLLSPLLLVVALAIKLDSRGPFLFRQTRHGYNNNPIRVFKFRSMTTMEDGKAFRQATKNDPRLTRFGRVIRRTNIDELPQLLNVLIGQMSIVGPRPHPVVLNQMFQKQISPLSRRHNVKPGITGWAQVNGHRGETDTLEKMRRRIECDLYYIDNWSFLLDIKIILMTLFSRRAYTNAF